MNERQYSFEKRYRYILNFVVIYYLMIFPKANVDSSVIQATVDSAYEFKWYWFAGGNGILITIRDVHGLFMRNLWEWFCQSPCTPLPVGICREEGARDLQWLLKNGGNSHRFRAPEFAASEAFDTLHLTTLSQ